MYLVFIYIYISTAHLRVDTADEFKTTMEKIPDYRIREEDVSISKPMSNVSRLTSYA